MQPLSSQVRAQHFPDASRQSGLVCVPSQCLQTIFCCACLPDLPTPLWRPRLLCGHCWKLCVQSTTCFIQTTRLWAGVLWPKGKTMLISPRCVQGCLPGIANQILHRKTKSNQSWLSGHFHDASTSAHSLMKCQQWFKVLDLSLCLCESKSCILPQSWNCLLSSHDALNNFKLIRWLHQSFF